MTLLLCLVIALAVVAVILELRRSRREATAGRLLALFAGVSATAREDPRRLLAWYPHAATARRLFPEAFGALDRAAGGAFPFTIEDVRAAHARWTAEWLAWERAHDFEYKMRAAEAEEEIQRRGEAGRELARARLEAIEREKLGRYQQRYEEYVRIARALAALDPSGAGPEGVQERTV